MKIIDGVRKWLNGVNICPNCGALHYKMCFGFTRMLCPDCDGKPLKERTPS